MKKKLLEFSRTNIINTSLLIGAIAILAFLFPKEGKFSYEYEMGKPWNYSLLTAPFDIPISVDSVTANKEKDSINHHFAPIYKRNVTVEKENITALYEKMTQEKLSSTAKNAILTCLQKVYENGIVDNTTSDNLRSGNIPGLRVIINNTAEPLPTTSVRSIRQAYAYIDSTFNDPVTSHTFNKIRLSDYLEPNIICDTVETKRLLEQQYQKALAPTGIVQQGERIVDRGDRITPRTYSILKTFEKMMQENMQQRQSDNYYPAIGQILIVTLLLGGFYAFMIFFRPRTYVDNKKMMFLVGTITLFSASTFVIHSISSNAVYLIPFAMVPICISTFIDTRTGFFANVIVILLCSLIVQYPLEFIILQTCTTIAAIVSIHSLTRRSQLLQCAFYVFVVYCLSYLAVSIVKEGNILHVSKHLILYFALNGIMLSFAYFLIFMVERFFGFISPVSLVELSDVNTPLLRNLSETCPGTFQHSLQVGNLAAEAAHKIGANVLLVRAGALYHDIGKTMNPAFFTENQRGVNPHDALTPEQSARIVINHVYDGIKLAEKAKLPEVIIDFIRQHHGMGTTKYFYSIACKQKGVENVDPTPFTYPGPNPSTKETTLLMMADATEAASKSLTDHTDEAIANIVSKVIDGQIADGMYADSPMSFRDIETIKKVFTDRLCTFYHTRVSYPDAPKAPKETEAETEETNTEAE